MRSDAIEALGIEDDATLWVKPVMATFPHIYREAMDVHWDAHRGQTSSLTFGRL